MFDHKPDSNIWWTLTALLASLIFSMAIGQGLSILLIIMGIYKVIKEKNISSFKIPLVLPFVVFIFIRILSIIFSEYPSQSVASLNKDLFFNLIFFVFLIALTPFDEKKIRFLIKILIGAAVIASIIGTIKVLSGVSQRASSTTSGYSTLGQFLSVIYVLVLASGKDNKLFPSRTLWFIILLITFTGIIFTFNRVNWAAVAIISLIIGFYKERIFLLILLIITAGVVLLVPNISTRFDQLIHFSQYMSDRDVIWRGALMIWDEHPLLGFGTRTFHEIFPLYDQLADKGVGGWHNEYLHIYIESGILGLTAYLWLMCSVFYHGIRVVRNFTPKDFHYSLIIALLAGYLVLYISSISGGFILDPITKVIFLFLLAVEGSLISSGKTADS